MDNIQNIYDNQQFYDEYKKMRDSKINANELIEIPTMKSMLPNLKNKTILDLGCGSGGMARYFVEQGAKSVFAIDISQNMINEAKAQPCDKIEYQIMPMEDINKISKKFDIVFSSLAFHYVEDFKKLIHDCYNLLKKNGILIFSQENPIATAIIYQEGLSKYIEQNGKRYYLVADYNDISQRFLDWNVKDVKKYHRNFETVINTLINEKFTLLELREPGASKEAIELVPKYKYQTDRPYFLFVKEKK